MWLPTRKLSAVADTPVWNRTTRKQSRAASSVSGGQSTTMLNNVQAGNNYLTEPAIGQKFNVDEAMKIVIQVLNARLGPNLDDYGNTKSRATSVDNCVHKLPSGQPLICCSLANWIRQSLVRELAATDTRHGGRYKLVVHVLHLDTPAQVAAPDMMASSCGLWNSETDRWFTVTHRIPDGKILITVFACYHE
ncbi:uncharacterized protein DEA37_0014086 [Paragonimus westermani]|uniref:Dynein light chain Tctex-type 1 n=1 Tax=Paragonimus westermani TaxID=34504 RepID=A0A5J4N6V2_9TREM|nr:uncharacterized protein DEA37_0014086 [Paragonimus westermani]